MIRIALCLLTLLCLSHFCVAQNEYNIWYFGDKGGINFNSGTAVPLTSGKLTSREGPSTICDAAGNLLFYTDGAVVYNKLHQVMANGGLLQPYSSSAQGSVSLPWPGQPGKYFIFTTSGSSYGGYRYSVVDMALQGGNGEVISINTLLDISTTEKQTATRHSNGQDFWLITHPYNSNATKVWSVTSSGVALNSVHYGGMSIDVPADRLGNMTFSRDATILAHSAHGKMQVDFFKFDNTAGKITGPFKSVNTLSTAYRPTGITFSPSGRFVYLNGVNTTSGGQSRVRQYDLCSPNLSYVEIYSNPIWNMNNMEIGPDNKIYISSENRNNYQPYGYASVINQPDQYGLASNFVRNGLNLNGGKMWSVSPRITGNYVQTVANNVNLGQDRIICSGSNIVLSASNNFGSGASYYWNTGAITPSITVSSAGQYVLRVSKGGCQSYDTVLVTITTPTVDLGPDITLCKGDTILLFPVGGSNSASSYQWNTGAMSPSITVSQSGTYILTRSFPGCSASDTVSVQVFNDSIDLGEVLINFCPKPITFRLGVDSARFPNADFQWNNGESTSYITATDTGQFYLHIITADGCELSDTTQVEQREQVEINLGPDRNLCSPEMLTVRYDSLFSAYRWSNGSTDTAILVTEPGTYTLTVTDICGDRTDSVTFFPAGELNISNVVTANGDGLNDAFAHGLTDNFLRLCIFNRWGKEVFVTSNAAERWDGKGVPTGIYYYSIEYVGCGEEPQTRKGWVQLFR